MQNEVDRQNAMRKYEELAYAKGAVHIAGIDEVGRGPLAGPVVSAAVILPKDVFIEGVNDSKKLSISKREKLFEMIKEKCISYGLGVVDCDIVDSKGIVPATRLSMEEAVNNLKLKPDFLLIDAEKLNIGIESFSIVKGDNLSISIASASIVAKVLRDEMMNEFGRLYPQYGFEKHKGYGTAEHIKNIRKYGLCPIHRITFTKKFVS